MSTVPAIALRAFLGDAERDFVLTSPMLAELERKTGFGVIELFRRLGTQQFTAAEPAETIRFALIGAGTAPAEAHRLVGLYVEDRPVMEGLALAFAILDRRINGVEPVKPAPTSEPAPSEPESEPAADLDAHAIGSE